MGLLRSAAVLLFINGAGFGLPCVLAIRHLMAGQDIPFIMGFPAYGKGPFERIGIPTTVPLLTAFLLICLLEIVAGALLWNAEKSGAILALVLLPLGVLFWWGFALPIPPMFALARTVLIVLNLGAPELILASFRDPDGNLFRLYTGMSLEQVGEPSHDQLWCRTGQVFGPNWYVNLHNYRGELLTSNFCEEGIERRSYPRCPGAPIR